MSGQKKYLNEELKEIANLDKAEKQQLLNAKLLKAYSAYEVKFWLDAGANPDTPDEHGRTKLIFK